MLIFFFQALYASMSQYLQGLFTLARDPASEVRKLVNIFSLSHYYHIIIYKPFWPLNVVL